MTPAPFARALAARNYDEPTPVQLAVLEAKAEGRDLVVSAQTGSGKTVAYGLAIAATLLGEAERFPLEAAPAALIVAPTRELALQVERELAWLYEFSGARILSCVGGMDPKRERRQLADGAHIIVGTPGRLRDHLERGALNITDLKAVVLDEADEMLDLGFREDLEFILEATPAARRTLLFSATMPKTIASMAKRYQRDALRIDVSGKERAHADIEYRAMRVAPNEVEHAVVNVLRFVEPDSAIVFCNTRDHVRHLHATLLERGFSAVNLSGELSQSERNHALQALRDGRAGVCVATDVAARGIDLPNLGLVIHADLPNDAETLQHRSGRTGRAGKKGVSVVLIPLSRRRKAEQLLAGAGVNPVWSGPPQAEEIRKLDQQRMMKDPALTQAASEEDREMARAVMAMLKPEEIAAALVRIYLSKLPAAEDVFDPGPGRDAGGGKPNRRDDRTQEPRAYTWFRLDIGRKNNADPKWLLPMICRRGKVTKIDIGAIRITDNETRFEIVESAAERFMVSASIADKDDVKIELLAGGHDAAPAAPRHFERKPKHGAEKPAYEDRKPHPAGETPKFETPGKPKGEGYKGKKPWGESGKPPFKGKKKDWKKK